MGTVFEIQRWVVLALGAAALAAQLYALVHALRQRPDAFTAAGKLSKPAWVGILVVASLLGFVSLGSGLGLLAIVAVVAAGVYLADVKPAIEQVLGRGDRRRW